MCSKKAVELSLNFIVVIIISLVIFGFGILFISNLFSKAEDLSKITLDKLDEKIGSLVCEGSERVCISNERKVIPKEKFDVFGIKILNILDTQDFEITVTRPSPSGYKKNNAPILPNEDTLTWKARPMVNIPKNEEVKIGIGIHVPKDAIAGTYIFNVEIKQADGQLYVPIQKLYAEVP